MHGITDEDVKKAPSPADAAQQAAQVHRRRHGRRPLRRASTSASSRRPSATAPTSSRAATSTRWSSPARATRISRTTSSTTLSKFFGIELAQAHRALPDAEATANLLIWFGNDLPGRARDAPRGGIADVRSGPPARTATARRLLEAARREARVSKSLFSLVQQEDRPPARPRRGHPHGRPRPRRAPPDLGRGRPPAARPRLRPVHPRRDPGPDGRHARFVLGRPADRHDQPRRPRSATSTTTTSRPTAPARTSRCAAPAGATSATATWPSGRSSRSCRRTTSSRTSSGSCPSA